MTVTDMQVIPTTDDPEVDSEEGRVAHIVLEGWELDDGQLVPVGNSVVEGTVYGTPVEALCGRLWVPGRDPRAYPLCQACREIAEGLGWTIPTS